MQQMFGSSANNFKTKVKAEVELTLNDGTLLAGNIFISPTERILDTLNDSRAFLPFERSDGLVTVLSKSIITHITLIERRTGQAQSMPEIVEAA